MDSIAELRKRRISLGISLGELARAVGRSDATVSRIERGKIRPSYELVQKILGFLEGQEGQASPRLVARDLVVAELVTIDAGASLADAATLMERGGFSQLPVLDGSRVTGAISESTLLRALASPSGRRQRVRDIQEGAYPIVDTSFPAELLAAVFTRYPAVLVAERGQLRGIVTKTDLIRTLRGAQLRRAGAATSVATNP
ncbi:MAG TPA: CBS domain-containing protein [Thermoplasmata archaeon]|nr:CBS domain-containing protein [Thermoplasmata archaeon]